MYNFLCVVLDERWLSAQFLSFRSTRSFRIEAWITCIYKHFVFIFQVNYVLLKFKVLIHSAFAPVELSVTFLSAVFISVNGHVVVGA